MGKIKTAKRQTIWNVINIKSRGIQTPQTYIHAFECLKEQDPLIQLRGNRHMSIKSMSQASYIEKEGVFPIHSCKIKCIRHIRF